MKIKSKAFVLIALLVLMTSGAVYAESITLPSFDVTINGTTINVENDEYPLIVYNNITYLPMTYNFSRSLGLSAVWDANTGLTISKTGTKDPIKQTLTANNKMTTTYRASLPSFDIVVNGKKINNAEEDYPLLLFRDITYFPMTWHYMVDEFGLNYAFDASHGLQLGQGNQPTTPTQTSSTKDLTEIEISNLLDPAVVKLYIYDDYDDEIGTGSGFVIDSNGTIATNFHVIEGGAYAVVEFNDKTTYTTDTVLSYDQGRDVAVIKLDNVSGLKTVALGDSSRVQKGQHVLTMGSPIGLFNSISEGIVSNINQTIEDYDYIQITAPISPGSSGGVLVNYQGQVIGITSAQFTEGQNLNLVIPINEAKAYFKDYEQMSFADMPNDTYDDWYSWYDEENYETITYGNGDVYYGEVYDGLPDGYGTMAFANGDSYEGYWYQGMLDYWGIYEYANGDYYDGDFLENLKEGYGYYEWADGSYYDGDWTNDIQNGYGYMVWANGDEYYGEFWNGMMHGEGTLYKADGTYLEGEFSYDSYIEGSSYRNDPREFTDYDETIAIPTNMKGRAISSDSVEIGWDDTGADYYFVYYTTDPDGQWYYFDDEDGFYTQVYWTQEYSAELYSLDPGQTVYFIVTAVEGYSESKASQMISVTALPE